MTPFIILTYPRTGSELLCSALALHPDIRMKSEILNPHRYEDWRAAQLKHLGIPDLPFAANIDPTIPVSTIIYDQSPNLAKFVHYALFGLDGFKIAYNQLTRTSPVIQLLKKTKLKVIFMERNYLESAVSYWYATTTRIWQKEVGHRSPQPARAIIDPKYVDDFCETAHSDNLFYRNVFIEHHTMTVRYTDLVKHWPRTIIDICRFLGASYRDLAKPLDKRLDRPLHDLVVNWSDLQKSQWAGLP
jgi:LPS sulfotransferase NodH